ncbi:FtsK/SpoIIIE family DNA translocase [Coralliovum pocilloporae]|uniref:FtsK/SpoIIIE family DNA translocase n=1 Tax=Coralliovum pocilloporae TaxID=3066369 RepID=UPI003307913D
MRSSKQIAEPSFESADPLRRALVRNAAGAAGLLIIGLAAALAASLATWSISDESLSNATSAPISNALGYPGAVIADLMMQLFGLASLTVVFAAVLTGWRMLSGFVPDHTLRRTGVLILSILLASAAVACLPLTQNWPLPTRLGGLAGDMLIYLPAMLIGGLGSYKAYALAVAFAAPSIWLFKRAIGTEPLPERHRQSPDPEGNQDREDPPFDDDDFPEDEDPEEDDERSGSLRGALTHWRLSLGARIKRGFRTPAKPSRPSLVGRLLRSDDGLDQFMEPTTRRERDGHDHHQGFDDDLREDFSDRSFDHTDPHLEPFDEEEDDEPVSHHTGRSAGRRQAAVSNHGAAPASSERVTPPAPKPKPGKRMSDEAQASFFASGDDYELPPLRLLAEPKSLGPNAGFSKDALEQNARLLEGVLEDFGVRGEIINVRPGPVVTLYELEPAPGTKSSRVIGLADDIARSMSAISARVAVVQGRNAIGIELPNTRRETVFLRELLAAQDFEKTKAKLALCLGKTIGGEPVISDLARMPHLLIAGTTGSGKSVAVNTMILSILYRLTHEECKMIMIDPKMLELSVYDGIPHLLTPVVTDPKKAVVALKWTVREMEDRYKKMSKVGVRNIDGFNQRVREAARKGETITRTVQTGFDRETGEAIYEQEDLSLDPMPFIVVIVDEMADLMMVAGKDIEGAIQRLAQMARAAGIHLIMATQRPSVDVITGTIKANFPTRISFQVTSKIDSRTILGEQGAEQLLGQGDMLYMAGGGRIQRVHGPFVSDDEVEQIVAHLKLQGIPQYLESITEEDEAAEGEGYDGMAGGSDESNDLYDRAVAIVIRDKKASTSYIQRRLSIGYNRAASIIERMEDEGVVGSANHAGKREILVGGEDEQF